MRMIDLPPLTFAELVAIGNRIRIPQPIEPRDPATGDVWRARWDDNTALVVVLSTEKSTVRVAPLTFASIRQVGDSGPVVAGRAVHVAWRRSGVIPEVTLDALFGSIDVETAQISPSDEFESLDDDLAAELAPLASWAANKDGDGSLPAALRTAGIAPSRLAEVLRISVQAALNIARGKRAVMPDQAVFLAEVLPLTPDEVLDGNPALPADLVSDFQERRHRSQLRRLGASQNLTDSEAWRSAAYSVLPVAARHTGGPVTGWHLKIDRYFESEGILRE